MWVLVVFLHQQFYGPLRDGQLADGVGRLGLTDHQFAVDAVHLLADRDGHILHVQVRPQQGEELAPAQTGGQLQIEGRQQSAPFCFSQIRADLVLRQYLHLTLFQLRQAAALGGVGEDQPLRYRLLQTVVQQRVDAPHHTGAEPFVFQFDVGMQTAADHYSILKANVPFQRWNWRAFTFSFDYLLKEDPIANEDECRSIVEHYKKYLPYEEKASMAESELEAALGNAAGSMSVLKEAISTHANASQCALRLADMQMNRGLFVDVLETTNYGIAASAEAQPSINIPYLYYIRALAKDHLLHKKVCSGEPVTKDELEALKEEYDLLLSEFPELMRHAHMIKMRVKMLKFVKAE